MINTNEHIIPVLDVRKILPLSVMTIRRLTASGKLETVRVGGRVFTSHEAVQRMLEQSPQNAPTPAASVTLRQRKRAEYNAKLHDELVKLLGGLDD